jgi:tRNA (guanine26-N2/guanine27-N2)-dimethyltransferase
MREWVRQKSPVKEGAVREGMAGWRISRNASGGKKDRQMVLREELRKLVEEGAGGGYEKLKMEVEAVLSRAESGENENAAMVEGVLAEGKMELNVGRLKIVFDEKLGKEPEVSRKLVRYQINPRANWGPMNRAKGDP